MKRHVDSIDQAAECEADSMKHAFHPRTMDFGKRLRTKYYSDGTPQLTGQKHRRAGAGQYSRKRVLIGHNNKGIPIYENK